MTATSGEVELLLKRLAPVVCFDRREQYFPSTVEYYLAHCQVIGPDADPPSPSAWTWHEILSSDRYRLREVSTDYRSGFALTSDLDHVPYYVQYHYDEPSDLWTLTYRMFFPYTGVSWWSETLWSALCPWADPAPPGPRIEAPTVSLLIKAQTLRIQSVRINGVLQTEPWETWDQRLVLYSHLYTHHWTLHPPWWWSTGTSVCPRFLERIDDDEVV